MNPQTEKDFCEQIDRKVSHMTALTMFIVTAAALISAMLIYAASIFFDIPYAMVVKDVPPEVGSYTILGADEVYYGNGCTVSVDNIGINENTICATLNITSDKDGAFTIDSSYFDIFISSVSGDMPFRCDVDDIGEIELLPGQTASVKLCAEGFPTEYAADRIISVIYKVYDSRRTLEFVQSA